VLGKPAKSSFALCSIAFAKVGPHVAFSLDPSAMNGNVQQLQHGSSASVEFQPQPQNAVKLLEVQQPLIHGFAMLTKIDARGSRRVYAGSIHCCVAPGGRGIQNPPSRQRTQPTGIS
jgi:hypothetical protein